MELRGAEALGTSRSNSSKRFPSEENPRFQTDLLFPTLNPSFTLDGSAKVFTIGSCFARNIEIVLAKHAVDLPTMSFRVDESEWPHRPNGLLNQYNPGTTSQRILAATGEWQEPAETIVESDGGYMDLSLPGGSPVTYERATERRREIDGVYAHLTGSDLVIITLGLVEAWFDHEAGAYLNKMPGVRYVKKNADRYSFRRLNVAESLDMLDRAISSLISCGVERVLLTVSPVPLGTTFTSDDAVAANSYSKSVLRVCADELTNKYQEVDYFPSYEIVTSGGLAAFNEDNIHVRPKVVSRVTEYMLSSYFPNLSAAP